MYVCWFCTNKLPWLGFENSPFLNEISELLEKVDRVPFTLSSSHIWRVCRDPCGHSPFPSTRDVCQNCTALLLHARAKQLVLSRSTGQNYCACVSQLHSCQTDRWSMFHKVCTGTDPHISLCKFHSKVLLS